MDIVEFLGKRLDEDELRANAVIERNWTVTDDGVSNDGSRRNSVCWTPGGAQAQTVGDHIARHDPARVLAEVKAKRARLALYVEVTDVLFHGGSGDRIKYQRESGRFEALDLEVRRDAALYADHPDFKQEWSRAL